MAENVIRFSKVAKAGDEGFTGSLRGMDLELAAGETALVLVPPDGHYPSFCDLAEGLVDPDEGSVEFMGKPWTKMDGRAQEAGRGRIGRVFEEHGWISNLSVYGNIVLSERHHTTRTEADIRQEVEQWAALAALAPVPESSPEQVPRSILKKAEWVRACLGRPALMLLERPEQGVPEEWVPALAAMAERAASGGTAVLWITSTRSLWNGHDGQCVKKFQWRNGDWIVQERAKK